LRRVTRSYWNHTVKNKSLSVTNQDSNEPKGSLLCAIKVTVTHSKEQVAVACKSQRKEQVMYCVTVTRRDCDLSRTSYWLLTNKSLDSSHVLCDCDSSWMWLVTNKLLTCHEQDIDLTVTCRGDMAHSHV